MPRTVLLGSSSGPSVVSIARIWSLPVGRLDKAFRAAYQHIIYLKEGAGGGRLEDTIRLDGDNETALHGDLVWAALCDKDKAFGNGEFNTQALLHQLRDSDLGRPLSEIRDSFWNTPRFPLLHSGESELRAAILGAVRSGDLVLTDGEGNSYTAHSEAEINLQSNSIRLVRAGASTQVTVPAVVGLTVEAATRVLAEAGLTVSAAGSGTAATQSPSAGMRVDSGSTVALTLVPTGGGGADGSEIAEYQVKISTITSIEDTAKRDALRLLVNQISNAIDTTASHIRLAVEVTVAAVTKDKLCDAANNADATSSVTEL